MTSLTTFPPRAEEGDTPPSRFDDHLAAQLLAQRIVEDVLAHADPLVEVALLALILAAGLARRIEGLTVQSAQQLINAYHKRFPSIQQFFRKGCVEPHK